VAFFRTTLASVVVMSCFSAIFQGSFVSTASQFPTRNMHYYATGQSAAALYAVIAQILSLCGQLEPTTSALYYFISADLFLVITLVVYLSLPKYVSVSHD
jgi:equilibrative nucleoside transporter 1/2/3